MMEDRAPVSWLPSERPDQKNEGTTLVLIELLFLLLVIALLRLFFAPLSFAPTTVIIVWLLLAFTSYLVGEFESTARVNYGLTIRTQASFALTYVLYQILSALWRWCEPLNVKFWLALWCYLTFLGPFLGIIFRRLFPQRVVFVTDFNKNKVGLLRWWGFECSQVVPLGWLGKWLKHNSDRLGRVREFKSIIVDISTPNTLLFSGAGRNQVSDSRLTPEQVVSSLVPHYFVDFVGVSSFKMSSYLLGPHPRPIGPFVGEGIDRRMKRVVDLLISFILLVALGPLLLFVAFLIKLTTPGPVFYRHRRLGRNMREFNLLKFRTMYQNADILLEKILSADPEKRREFERTFKLKNDPRVTPVGRWLRRTSIDELPQLLNIFAGQMSLVGPRPIVEKEIPYYEGYSLLIFRVPPGVTGLWQISGRTDISYEERVRLDTKYVREWSLLGDLAIILKTIPVVLSRRGAY